MKTDKKLFYKVPFKGILAAWILFLCSYGQTFAQCPGQTANVVVSTNTLWAISATIDHNTEVTSGATLTMQTATFSFIPNVKITIDYGGHLLINNAILTNKCTGLWGGIVVIGNSEAAQNSSMSSITIENGSQINYAKTGVLMGDSADSAGGGGLMSMIGSSINNCREGVIFYGYPDSDASVLDSSFFTSSALLPGYDSSGMLVGLSLNDVYGIIVAGCSFSNSIDPSLLSARNGGSGTGISGKDAGYAVVSASYAYNGDPRTCFPGYSSNFSKQGVGISNIDNLKGASAKKHLFTCENTKFSDNYVDILDENSQYTLITKCDFVRDATWFASNNYPLINTTNSTLPFYYPIFGHWQSAWSYTGMYGIFSTSSSNIDISNDTFYWDITGEPNFYKFYCYANGFNYPTIIPSSNGQQIFIQNSGGSTVLWPTNGSRIYFNQFGIDVHTDNNGTYCGDLAQFFTANTLDGNNGGLEILCNTYNVRGWIPTSSPRIPGGAGSQATLCNNAQIGDWYLAPDDGSIQLPAQGNLPSNYGAGNNFTDYWAEFSGSPSLSDNLPGAGGALEFNILADTTIGSGFQFNYYNHANWDYPHSGDIFPEIWYIDYNHDPISASYEKNASHSGTCSANDCMNFVQESTYTPGGTPTGPLFVPQIPSGVKLYPNPTANLLNIEYNFGSDNNGNQAATIQLQIIDFSGKTISMTLLNQAQGSMTLDTKTLASGVYFYRFTDTNANKILNSGKFAVSR